MEKQEIDMASLAERAKHIPTKLSELFISNYRLIPSFTQLTSRSIDGHKMQNYNDDLRISYHELKGNCIDISNHPLSVYYFSFEKQYYRWIFLLGKCSQASQSTNGIRAIANLIQLNVMKSPSSSYLHTFQPCRYMCGNLTTI